MSDTKVKEESFPYVLSLIHPKLAFQQSLTKQVKYVEPLKEIQLQEGKEQLDFLAPELQEVVKHSAQIQKQFELQPQRLSIHSLFYAVSCPKCHGAFSAPELQDGGFGVRRDFAGQRTVRS